MANMAQNDCVIMQLMLDKMISMYKLSIKVDHNKFANEVHKLIDHV